MWKIEGFWCRKNRNSPRSYFSDQKCSTFRQHLPRDEQEALKSLKGNSDIIIAPADKGCSVVVLDKSTYQHKTMEHLNDTNTYNKIDDDPSSQLRTKINKFLKTLMDTKIISKFEYEWKSSNCIPLIIRIQKKYSLTYLRCTFLEL